MMQKKKMAALENSNACTVFKILLAKESSLAAGKPSNFSCCCYETLNQRSQARKNDDRNKDSPI